MLQDYEIVPLELSDISVQSKNARKNSKVYIIVLNYNGWEDTIECLESLLKNNYPDYQIIVVDNNSPNKSMNHLLNWAESFARKPFNYLFYTQKEALEREEKSDSVPLVFIQAETNGGFSSGNNIGIRYAMMKNDFEYICLLNNDTVVDVDFLNRFIVDAVDASLDIAGSKIYYHDKPEQLWFNGGDLNTWIGKSRHIHEKSSERITYCNFITGACMLIHKNVLESIGMLDESYFMYSEDLDYCYRAAKKKFRMGIVHSSHVWHKVGASSKNEISNFSAYFIYRNAIWFRKKNFSFIQKLTSGLYDLYNHPLLLFKLTLKYPKLVPTFIKATIDGYMYKKTFSPNEK